MTELSIQILHVLLWGLIATAAMSGVQFGAQRLGYSRLSLPFLIGTMFTGERAAANVAGMVFYVLGGWLFAFMYYFIFASLERAGWWIGALVGFAHGMVLLVALLPLLNRKKSRPNLPLSSRTLAPRRSTSSRRCVR